MEELIRFLEKIEDVRQDWKVQHKLSDIVVIVLFATLSNADDWVEIGIFAKSHEELLKEYISLENGAPSHDTIQRVMSSLSPEVFKQLQAKWQELINLDEGEKLKKILSIDGKTMRGTANKNQEALHVVSAWSKEDGVCFGQKSVEGKGKEIPAINELLETVKVHGQVVTIDAIGTQMKIAEKIRAGKGDYVLAVKGNQGTLLEEIRDYFANEELKQAVRKQQTGQYLCQNEKAHGQIERREYYQTNDIEWLTGKKNWKGLRSIGMVETTCKGLGGQTRQTRYYISSLEQEIELFARSVRGHWSVEIMHWHLDVTFREDQNRTLEKTAAENMNIIRKWTLSMLKTLDLGRPYSLKKKRFAFSCNFKMYIDKLLAL